jgi:hypothetical protein
MLGAFASRIANAFAGVQGKSSCPATEVNIEP